MPGRYNKAFRFAQLLAGRILTNLMASEIRGDFQVKVFKPSLGYTSKWGVKAEWEAHSHNLELDPTVDTTVKGIEFWMQRDRPSEPVKLSVSAEVIRTRTSRESGESKQQVDYTTVTDYRFSSWQVFLLPFVLRRNIAPALEATLDTEVVWQEERSVSLRRVA